MSPTSPLLLFTFNPWTNPSSYTLTSLRSDSHQCLHPKSQARPPLHLTWITGSISYMIAPNPHLALPQLTLCSTTRQIPFKCHDISPLFCLNISHRTQNKIQNPPHAHTPAVMWALYLPPSPPHPPLPTHSNHTDLPTAPQIHQAQSLVQALVILFPLPQQSSPKYTRCFSPHPLSSIC